MDSEAVLSTRDRERVEIITSGDNRDHTASGSTNYRTRRCKQVSHDREELLLRT
jgi:hypothetical protein